jgi:hypothetical protein
MCLLECNVCVRVNCQVLFVHSYAAGRDECSRMCEELGINRKLVSCVVIDDSVGREADIVIDVTHFRGRPSPFASAIFRRCTAVTRARYFYFLVAGSYRVRARWTHICGVRVGLWQAGCLRGRERCVCDIILPLPALPTCSSRACMS